MRINDLEKVQITCFRCKTKFTFVGEFEYGFDPERDQIACVECAKKLGDDTMWRCWHCNAQFQRATRGMFEPEGCSNECENAIDLSVERAVQSQYDYIERRLEAL